MIRRWSYINHLNVFNRRELRSNRIGSSNALVNSLMFLRRRFPVITKANRKSWARRVHTNDLTYMVNVLIAWAKEYRFYRNYNRSSHYQFFSLNTYLSFNLTLSSSLVSRYSKHNVSSLGSGVHKRTLRYFSRNYSTSRMGFLLSFRNHSWSFASFSLGFSSSSEVFASSIHQPYAITLPNKSLVPVVFSDTYVKDTLSLLALPLMLSQLWVTSLYGILIKLTLHRLVR